MGLVLAGLIAATLAVVQPGVAGASGNGVMIAVVPDFPTRVAVGAPAVAATVNLLNGSVGAEATGSLTVTDLTLVPSCGNFTPTCTGGADPGVFSLSPTGTGEPGTNCAGRRFDITVADPATGRVRFGPSDGRPLVLAAPDITTELDTCRIRFEVSAQKLPAVDSHPAVEGIQTNQVGWMSVRHDNGSTATDQGEDITTPFHAAGTTPPTTTPPPPTTTTTTTPPPPPTTTTTTAPPPTTTTTTAPPPTTTTTVPPPTTTTTVPPVGDGRFERWIDRVYRDLVGRAVTPGEAAHWAGAVGANPTRHQRGWITKAITSSSEFRRLAVDQDFTAFLGRLPSPAERDALVDRLAKGASLQQVDAAVLATDEFYARQGGTPEDFARALHRVVLGVTPDPSAVSAIADRLATGVAREVIALEFTTHPAVHDRIATNGAYWLLRRAPHPAEVDGWSGALDSGVRVDHFYAFLACSDEYWSAS